MVNQTVSMSKKYDYAPPQHEEVSPCLKQCDMNNRGNKKISQIVRFIRPTWGPSGADRTQVGPMLAP